MNTNPITQLEQQEIQTYRSRVHFLEKDVWEEKDPQKRINLLIQLSSAVASLLLLENNTLGREAD